MNTASKERTLSKTDTDTDVKAWERFLEKLNDVCYFFIKYMFAAVFRPLFRIRVFGKENIPKKGPLLYLSNHQSFFDPIFCQVTCLRRSLYYVARDTLFKNGLVDKVLRFVHARPIKRGRADLASMRSIMNLLKRDKAVCLFPEGTRTSDGRIAKVKPGFGLLARRTGANVLPAVIEGAYECWPRHQKRPKLGKVAVIYGRPISAEQIKQMGDEAFAEMLTNELRRLQNECRSILGKEPIDYGQSEEKQ